MKKYLFFLLLCVVACGRQSDTPVYLDPSADIEARVEDALSRMSLDEKIAAIHAQSTFSLPGVKKLGIPELWTSDGPHGVRPEVPWNDWGNPGWNNDSCVAVPALTCLAATWNRDVACLYGNAIGEEARFREKDVILGPGVNMYRSPLCGRNFEYFSEDPMMTGSIAAAVCKGVASRPGNYVTIKHFAANNQEFQRNKASSNVSERAFREIYLRPFKRAIRDGSAMAVMTSYNPVNGIYNVENRSLLEDYLRGECGFEGIVMTDWTSTGPGLADPVQAIRAGNDMIMPGMPTDRSAIRKAALSGELDPKDLRRCSARVVRLLLESEQGKERLREWKLDRKG